MQTTLNEEQQADIKARTEKAMAALKELELVPAVQTASVNLGAIDPKFNSTFGTYLQCFLQDLKYSKKPEDVATS